MPRGDKSSYTDKQKRQAEHIEEGYKKRGLSSKTAESRAWATVNKESGGGKKSGSGKKKSATKKSAGRKSAAKKGGGGKKTPAESPPRKSHRVPGNDERTNRSRCYDGAWLSANTPASATSTRRLSRAEAARTASGSSSWCSCITPRTVITTFGWNGTAC